jgi:hypothetical protein
MWNVIITLTSVGYGDIYPKSLFGRLWGVLIAFWGVFVTSFFVVTVTNMLAFSPSEDKAYNLLLRLYYKTQLKREAVDVLSSAFLHRNSKINNPENLDQILSLFRSFRSSMLRFQNTAKVVRGLNDGDKDVDIMQSILEGLIEHVDALR